MPRLKRLHKVFITKRLACFETPTEIVQEFSKEFGMEIPPNQILCYHPEKVQGAKLSSDLKHLFYETHRKFVKEISDHEISHKGFRLAFLQKMFEKQYKLGNHVLAAEMLKQAAQEVGGAFEAKELQVIGMGNGDTFIKEVNQRIEQKIYNITNKK